MDNKKFWHMAKSLKPKDFVMYACIEKLCDNEIGYCFSSNKNISEKLGISERTVSRNISQLVEKNVIYSLEKKRGASVEERRIFTSKEYFLTYKNSGKKLIKTTYKVNDGIINFFNELFNNGSNNGSLKITEDKNVLGTEDKNVLGTEDKNVYVTNTNNNLSKITTTSAASLFKENNFSINNQTIKNIVKLEVTTERVKEVLIWAIKNNQGPGAIFNALKEKRELKDIKGPTKLSNDEKIKFMKDKLGKKEINKIKLILTQDYTKDSKGDLPQPKEIETLLNSLLIKRYRRETQEVGKVG